MTIRSYRRRLAQVQAMPFTTLTLYDALDWIRTNGGKATERSALNAGPVLIFQTPEGNKRVCLGDWILRSENGAFSSCAPREFVTLYDSADSMLPADRTAAALAEVQAERARQDARWGEQNHRDGTGNEQQQDAAEAARRWCQDAFASGYGTWSDVLAEEVAEANTERDPARLRAELVQVAAVAVAWIEAIDRRAVAPAAVETGE